MSDKAPVDRQELAKQREDLFKQREKILDVLNDKIKIWLLEFGNWIFGGLLAFNLVIVEAILTVGPEHPAILVAIASFACALPLNVAGLFLLKLIKDMRDLALGDVMKQAFEDANVPHYQPSEQDEKERKRGLDTGLRYVFILAGVSAILTLAGMIAALWYMAWWVSEIFCLMVVASILITYIVFSRMRPRDPATAAKRRLREQRARQIQNR